MDKLRDEYYYRDEEDDDCDSSEKEQIDSIIKYSECENGMIMSKGNYNGNGGWLMMMKNAGKKMVMTGVVISSAPVLLPPLLVVSALGLAMSVPFGVAFASFACTHKLITNLLPPPPPPLALPYYHYDYDEDEDDHHLDLQDPDINYYSLEQEEEEEDDDDDDEQVKNAEDMNEAEIINQRRLIELVDDDDDERETETETETTYTSYPPNNLITIIDHVDIDDLEREEEDHLEEDENDDDEGEINNTKLINEEEGRSRSENENSNNTIDVEEMTVQVKQGDGSSDGGLSLMNGNDDIDNKKKTGADMVGDAAASGEEDKDEPKVELKKEEKHSSCERNHSNDQLQQEKEWEKKINAIRVIVGFKAPRRTSYFEEVKALYLFTGIEPPTTSSSSSSSSSSSDHQNAAELDAKLNFLMSVIGLK